MAWPVFFFFLLACTQKYYLSCFFPSPSCCCSFLHSKMWLALLSLFLPFTQKNTAFPYLILLSFTNARWLSLFYLFTVCLVSHIHSLHLCIWAPRVMYAHCTCLALYWAALRLHLCADRKIRTSFRDAVSETKFLGETVIENIY